MDGAADRLRDQRAAPGRNRRRVLTIGSLLVAILLAAVLHGPVDAAGKKNRNRQAAAAAAAQKQRLVERLRRQIDAAQDVLAAARSSGSLSKQKLDEAAQKLSSIREELEQIRIDAKEAEKTRRAVEAEILAEQPPDSEYARAQKAVDEAKQLLQREIRRVLPAADPAKLTADQRETLEDDAAYARAHIKLEIAARTLERERQKLFQADPEWTAAQKDLYAARQEEDRQEQTSVATGVGTLDDKQNLKSAASLAAAAQSVIAQTEARLRRLGADPNRDSTSKRSRANKKRKQ